MDGGGGEAAVGQRGRHLVAGALGLAEDHGEAAVLGLQDAREHLDLVQVVRPVDVLGGERRRRGLARVLGADVHRLPQVPAGERHDLAGHRRGEQHRLPVARGEPEQSLHVGQEAEVEHLVRLVEDERADPAEVKVLAVGEVEQPPGGADDDVDAGREGLELRFVGAPAVDGEHPRAQLRARPLDVVSDLNGKFPGRHDDQCRWLLGGAVAGEDGRQPVQDGDAEGQGLAGAGPRLPDDVLAVHGQRQRQCLDGECRVDACGFERAADDLIDTEIAERHRML